MNRNDSNEEASSPSRGIPLEPAGERSLDIEDLPPRNEEPRHVHKRRPLPMVPDRRTDSPRTFPDSSDTNPKLTDP